MAMDINSYFDYGTADVVADDSLVDAGQLFVTLGTDGQFAVATTPADATVFGVLREGVPSGLAPAVRTGSITYVFAGEALTAGMYVTNDAEGKAVEATTGQIIHGQVLEGGAAADEEVKINLFLQAAKTVA